MATYVQSYARTETPITYGGEWTTMGYTTGTTITITTPTVIAGNPWDTDLCEDVWLQWTSTAATGQITMPATNEVIYRQWVEADDARTERRRLAAERDAQREEARRDALQRLREQENARRLREEQRIAVALEAQQKALNLFESLLTPDQREEWEDRREITVRGSAGGLYLLDGSREEIHGNVVQIDEHRCHLRRLCFAPQMWDGDSWREENTIPIADGWVGQLMAIRHDEPEVLRVANPSQIRRCLRAA